MLKQKEMEQRQTKNIRERRKIILKDLIGVLRSHGFNTAAEDAEFILATEGDLPVFITVDKDAAKDLAAGYVGLSATNAALARANISNPVTVVMQGGLVTETY